MAALYQKFLLLPVDHKYDALKSQTVSAMINLPACVNDSFDPLPTIASLIAILNTQAFKAGRYVSSIDSVAVAVAMAVVLTPLAYTHAQPADQLDVDPVDSDIDRQGHSGLAAHPQERHLPQQRDGRACA